MIGLPLAIASWPLRPRFHPPPLSKRQTFAASRTGKNEARFRKEKKSWDSPLILFGGGALVFLLLAAGTIWFLMFRESGDQMLTQARDALKAGAYPQAIQRFQDFLTAAPSHPEHSAAKVQLSMTRIRQATESHDFEQALSIAQTELKSVEDEPAFDSAHEESAALLPQIADGLAKQAEQAPPTSDDSKKFVDLANKALELCSNVTYIPKTIRDETKLANVRDTLVRVERRQESQLALADGIKAMESAIAAGKPIDSYAAQMKLLQEHPELASEASLLDAVKKTTAAEQATIKYVAEAKPAETAERPVPWLASLAVASHRVVGTAPNTTGTACVRIDGALYGIDAATGRLLWRRYVGYKIAGWPIPIGHDVLVADSERHELLRLDAASGKLLWRQSIGEAFADPLIIDDRALSRERLRPPLHSRSENRRAHRLPAVRSTAPRCPRRRSHQNPPLSHRRSGQHLFALASRSQMQRHLLPWARPGCHSSFARRCHG